MNYSDLVLKGRILVENYEDVRYELCILAEKVEELGVNMKTFSKDININHQTILSWYGNYKKYVKSFVERGIIKGKPTKNDYAAIALVRRMKGAKISQKDKEKYFNYYLNQSVEDRKLTNAIIATRTMYNNLNKVNNNYDIVTLKAEIQSLLNKIQDDLERNVA